jgi:hypothetical protein
MTVTNDKMLDIKSAFELVRYARSINAVPALVYHYTKFLVKQVNRIADKQLRSIAFRMMNIARRDYLRNIKDLENRDCFKTASYHRSLAS